MKSTLGENLKIQRHEKGITQEALAFEAGVSYRFVQEIENDKQQPTLPIIFKLSKALGITPDQLILPAWEQWLNVNSDTH